MHHDEIGAKPVATTDSSALQTEFHS